MMIFKTIEYWRQLKQKNALKNILHILNINWSKLGENFGAI